MDKLLRDSFGEDEDDQKNCGLCRKNDLEDYSPNKSSFDNTTKICFDCAIIENMFMSNASKFWKDRAMSGTIKDWYRTIFLEYFEASKKKIIEQFYAFQM